MLRKRRLPPGGPERRRRPRVRTASCELLAGYVPAPTSVGRRDPRHTRRADGPRTGRPWPGRPFPRSRAGYVTVKLPFMIGACGSHMNLYVPFFRVTFHIVFV